ncbi:MAG: glycosyltransferase [wastewater metagenome]|nr:glycosyltransferase [Candidatus Loosdrechtia aerotolerans]
MNFIKKKMRLVSMKKYHHYPPTIRDYIIRTPHPDRIEGGMRICNDLNKGSKPLHPMVSIVTIVRNGVSTLEQTIQSVLNQTYDAIEYIIVDGCSTDGTLDIIRKYDNRLAYWISEPDEGISDAFNKGIALSTGKIIGIVNADDWYELDTVDWVVRQFNKEYTDIIYGIVQCWDSNQKVKLVHANDALLTHGMTVNHATVFVSRSAYEMIGLFRCEFHYAMDYEWLLRARNRGLHFSYIEQCMANMRLGGISDRYLKQVLWEWKEAKDIYSPSIFHSVFFLFQLVKGLVSRCLNKIGFQGVVHFYHTCFSKIKISRKS